VSVVDSLNVGTTRRSVVSTIAIVDINNVHTILISVIRIVDIIKAIVDINY